MSECRLDVDRERVRVDKKNLGQTVLLVLAEWLGLLLVLGVLSQLALAHHVPSGHCEGIGFGCNLTPADTAFVGILLLGLIGSPIVVIACIPLALFWCRRSSRFRARSAWVRALSINGCFVGLVLALLVLAATSHA